VVGSSREVQVCPSSEVDEQVSLRLHRGGGARRRGCPGRVGDAGSKCGHTSRLGDHIDVPVLGSRDGLLAEVLIGSYEDSFEEQYAVVREHLRGTSALTIDDVVASIPPPHHERAKGDHALRSQVLAVAGVNPILRSRLAEGLSAKRIMLNTIIDDVETRLPEGVTLNREVSTVLVFNLDWQHNDLLGEHAVTNSQCTKLFRRLLVKK